MFVPADPVKSNSILSLSSARQSLAIALLGYFRMHCLKKLLPELKKFSLLSCFSLQPNQKLISGAKGVPGLRNEC